MTQKGFILKEAVISATETLSDAEFRKLIMALFNYAVHNQEPEFNNNEALSKAIFQMEQPAIDANNMKWMAKASQFKPEKEYPNLAKEILGWNKKQSQGTQTNDNFIF